MIASAFSASLLAMAVLPSAAGADPKAAAAADSYFVVKLIPPRPAFATSMTGNERAVMDQHIAYWRAEMKSGKVLIFGPVRDPAGVYGLMILRASGEAEARELISNDPAVLGGIGMRPEIHPFIESIVGGGN